MPLNDPAHSHPDDPAEPRDSTLLTPEEQWAHEAGPRMFFLLVIVPAVVVLVGVVLMISYLPLLPELVIINWGFEGQHSYASPWVSVLLLPLVVLSICIAFASSIRSALKRRSTTRLAQAGAAFTVGISVFLTFLVTVSLALQRGTSGGEGRAGLPGAVAPDAGAIFLWALVALVAGALAGAIAWRLAPAPLPVTEASAADTADAAPRLALAPNERGYWQGKLRTPWLLHVLLWVIVGAVATLMVISQAPVWATLLLLAVLLPTAFLLNWRATVDHRGVYATGVFGWPRIGVPLEQIKRATVTEVEPMADFGGWGVRLGYQHQFGIVLRRGPAIRVERLDGKRTLVITHPDAATAVALINALVPAREAD